MNYTATASLTVSRYAGRVCGDHCYRGELLHGGVTIDEPHVTYSGRIPDQRAAVIRNWTINDLDVEMVATTDRLGHEAISERDEQVVTTSDTEQGPCLDQ